MTFIKFSLVAAILISSASRALSQAPEDFDKRCDAAASSYPAEWTVLLDTLRYERLPSIWKKVDFDGDLETVSILHIY